jgi:hypothetical protein
MVVFCFWDSKTMSKTGFRTTKKFRDDLRTIEKIPEYMEAVVRTATKQRAIQVVRAFRKGIISDGLGLKPLADTTIKRKQKMGFTKPSTPLYGKGRRARDRAYINSLNIRTLKKGYTIRPSKRIHHSSGMKLSDMFMVHEYGTVIKTKFATIRIPPRPALLKARDRVLTTMSKKEVSKIVRRAYEMAIRRGDFRFLKAMKKRIPDWSEYDET